MTILNLISHLKRILKNCFNLHEDAFKSYLEFFYLDARFGVLSLLPNLLQGYGWNPGNRIYNWFGEVMEQKTGSKDITFSEVSID